MRPRPWNIGGRRLGGNRPLIMGIVNVTPDSFFDGGLYNSRDKALRHCEQMIASGADIIDVGGESTRPGSESVSAEEETKRVSGIIREITARFSVPVSIDTAKAAVAEAALAEGAVIINDVTGFTGDPRMAETAAGNKTGVVLGHILGTPRTMQDSPRYADVVKEVREFLQGRVEHLEAVGVPRENIAVDPGIGFGKQLVHNYQIIAHLEDLETLGCPVVMGMSRKSFIGKTSGLESSDRLQPSAAAATLAALKGASVLRVHDVAQTWEQLRIIEAILSEGEVMSEERGMGSEE
ncbi:dihydropteroate synthase [Fibrobacterota bacterium]